MKIIGIVLSLLLSGGVVVCATPQDSKASDQSAKPSASAATPDSDSKAYSGMYTFLKEGEFVQITVEDDNRVNGFVSRYGDGESDSGAFLDQFFKSGKVDGNKLTFTTELVHGVTFEFKGSIERGEGKNPGDDSYYVIKGSLTQNVSDANKKVTSTKREVVFKMFPQDAAPSPTARN